MIQIKTVGATIVALMVLNGCDGKTKPVDDCGNEIDFL